DAHGAQLRHRRDMGQFHRGPRSTQPPPLFTHWRSPPRPTRAANTAHTAAHTPPTPPLARRRPVCFRPIDLGPGMRGAQLGELAADPVACHPLGPSAPPAPHRQPGGMRIPLSIGNKASSNQRTTKITTAAFRMLLIFSSMGMY